MSETTEGTLSINEKDLLGEPVTPYDGLTVEALAEIHSDLEIKTKASAKALKGVKAALLKKLGGKASFEADGWIVSRKETTRITWDQDRMIALLAGLPKVPEYVKTTHTIKKADFEKLGRKDLEFFDPAAVLVLIEDVDVAKSTRFAKE